MDASEQVPWLVDRAQISDLLVEFARALDDMDAGAYAATYADDGVLRRSAEGWRFAVVLVHLVWRSGTGPLPGESIVTEGAA